MPDRTDPTELSPFEIPDLPAGEFTQQLDDWLKTAIRWGVREEAQGLPDWPRPEDETPGERRAAYQGWFYALANFLFHSTNAGLLIRIAQLAPEHVDAIAKELRDWIDSGDFYPEATWDWAEKRGLNPQALADEMKAQLREQAAEDAQPKPLRDPLKSALAALAEETEARVSSGFQATQEASLAYAALDIALEQLGVQR